MWLLTLSAIHSSSLGCMIPRELNVIISVYIDPMTFFSFFLVRKIILHHLTNSELTSPIFIVVSMEIEKRKLVSPFIFYFYDILPTTNILHVLPLSRTVKMEYMYSVEYNVIYI